MVVTSNSREDPSYNQRAFYITRIASREYLDHMKQYFIVTKIEC